MTALDCRYDVDGSTLIPTKRLQPPGPPPLGSDPDTRLQMPTAVQHYRRVDPDGVGSMPLADWQSLDPAPTPDGAGPRPRGRPRKDPDAPARPPGRPATTVPRVDSNPNDRRVGPHGLSVALYRRPIYKSNIDPDWVNEPHRTLQVYRYWTYDGSAMEGAMSLKDWREHCPRAPADWTPPEETWAPETP